MAPSHTSPGIRIAPALELVGQVLASFAFAVMRASWTPRDLQHR